MGRFLLWTENDQEATSTIRAFVDSVDGMVSDLNQQMFDSLLNSPVLIKLMAEFCPELSEWWLLQC